MFLLVAAASAAGSALAGEVYKCDEGGSTVYQDQPCPGHPEQAPRTRYPSSFEGADDYAGTPPKPAEAPPLGPTKEQLTSLYSNLHQAEQDRDRIEQAYKAEVAQAQQKYKDNQLAAAAEVRAINQRWTPQSQEVQQRQDALAAQAQQLCPGSKEVTSDGKCR
jgi:hypothetical protein